MIGPRLNGDVTMIEGDASSLIRTIPDKTVDLVITDPPYGDRYSTNYRKKSRLKGAGGIECDTSECVMPLLKGMVNEFDRVLKDDAHVYMFAKWNKVPEITTMLSSKFDVKNVLIWNKGNWSMGNLKGAYANQYEAIVYAKKGKKPLNCLDDKCRHSDMVVINRVAGSDQVHSHQKPVELIEFLVKKSSKPGDVVLDPFLGSGTTCVAARKNGRKCTGFEIDPETFSIALSRLR
jgi:DNA modification methylase